MLRSVGGTLENVNPLFLEHQVKSFGFVLFPSIGHPLFNLCFNWIDTIFRKWQVATNAASLVHKGVVHAIDVWSSTKVITYR